MTPTLTSFDADAMPTNLRTVPEFRALARNAGYASWQVAMRAFAKNRGGAYCIMADGRLRVLTHTADGKVRQSTYKQGAWAFASN